MRPKQRWNWSPLLLPLLCAQLIEVLVAPDNTVTNAARQIIIKTNAIACESPDLMLPHATAGTTSRSQRRAPNK